MLGTVWSHLACATIASLFGQQTVVPYPLQFVMCDDPLVAGETLLGVHPAKPTPFANGEFGSSENLRGIGGGIPFLNRFLLNDFREGLFNAGELFNDVNDGVHGVGRADR